MTTPDSRAETTGENHGKQHATDYLAKHGTLEGDAADAWGHTAMTGYAETMYDGGDDAAAYLDGYVRGWNGVASK